jgi:hypothetical protein
MNQEDAAPQRPTDDRLFSPHTRTDRRPAGYAESSFAFLDRVDQPYWARVRVEFDRWFAAFPEGQSARDLRNRFRKDDHGQHYGAWWELYLHRLFTRLGYHVEVHPELDGTTDRPDFRIRTGSGSFLVEAATTFSGIDDGRQHSRLESQVMDAINQGSSDTFTIALEFARIGNEMPGVREIVRPIESWLEGLDPDADWELSELPNRVVEIRDWELEITAFPVAPEYRGKPGRLLAFGPMLVGSVNDVEKLRGTLDRKRRKYGDVREPFLFAVLMPSTFADNSAVEKALFGDTALQYRMGERGNERWVRLRNGFWTREDGPRASWVSGVITGFGILPGALVATRWPRLWPNPWATVAMDAELPLPRSVGSMAGEFLHDEDGPRQPREFLGLDPGWPGPEPPFLRSN